MAVVVRAPAQQAETPFHRIEARPPPDRYARGWHCLGLAQDYKDGKPHTLRIFGTKLVLFMGEDGKVRALDAYCPHMGADLGIGCVKGNSIVCKFHGWSWNGDGACDHIPYAKRIPPKARTRAWPTMEQNKLLFVWNDPEGRAPIPEQEIPRIDHVFSPDWSDWSMVKWEIKTNCRELVDNIADMAHFGPVHGGNGVVYFANIFEGHKATQVMVGSFESLGGKDDYLTTIASYFGPAYQITHMFGNMNGYPVESILMNSHTPIDPNSFELRFGVMVKKFPGMSQEQCDAMVKQYQDMTNVAFGQDVEIWHNKVRIDNPLLCEGDGPIIQNRQWYENFYKDYGALPADYRKKKVVEIDRGLQKKPALAHAFES
jgi:3-ketosteroid 9alpha-monooxygenase subunit A